MVVVEHRFFSFDSIDLFLALSASRLLHPGWRAGAFCTFLSLFAGLGKEFIPYSFGVVFHVRLASLLCFFSVRMPAVGGNDCYVNE